MVTVSETLYNEIPTRLKTVEAADKLACELLARSTEASARYVYESALRELRRQRFELERASITAAGQS